MYHFAMLTPHEQLVKHKNLKMVLRTAKVTIFRKVLSRIYGTLCGPLEDHVENHWSKCIISFCTTLIYPHSYQN